MFIKLHVQPPGAEHERRYTPAMAAGATDTVHDIDWIAGLVEE